MRPLLEKPPNRGYWKCQLSLPRCKEDAFSEPQALYVNATDNGRLFGLRARVGQDVSATMRLMLGPLNETDETTRGYLNTCKQCTGRGSFHASKCSGKSRPVHYSLMIYLQHRCKRHELALKRLA